MEEALKQPECFLVREEPIRRVPKLIFAASAACRRASGDPQSSRTALPRAIGAQCTLCGFVLSGEELLALAEIARANEKSAMLQRLRDGKCARQDCKASHYRLQFYNTPEINWSTLLAEFRPKETSQLQSEPASAPALPRRNILPKLARIAAVLGLLLFAWLWWQWYTGGTIPILRQPEHFRVEHGEDRKPMQ
jgi:hypothetical protein